MKRIIDKVKIPDVVKKNDTSDYQLYPIREDIYNKFKEEEDVDPEDISRIKASVDPDDDYSEIDHEIDGIESGIDLDVPGSELDDEEELIGNEDEENNYYSLGGDDHNDLDEDESEL
jgi:hypothetical protein